MTGIHNRGRVVSVSAAWPQWASADHWTVYTCTVYTCGYPLSSWPTPGTQSTSFDKFNLDLWASHLSQVTVVCYHWSGMSQFTYYGGYWYQGQKPSLIRWPLVTRGWRMSMWVKNTNIQVSPTEKPDKGPHSHTLIELRVDIHGILHDIFPSPSIISLASWPGFLHNGVIDPSGVGSSGSRHPGLTTGYIYLSHMTLKLGRHTATQAQLLLVR